MFGCEGGEGGEGGKGGKSPGHSRRGSTTDEKSGNGGGFSKSWKKELSLRARWVIAGNVNTIPHPPSKHQTDTPPDKEKFGSLLRDLRDFNDGLERLFPASHLASFERAWTFRLLETAHRDLTQLSLLETAAVGVYPHLTASATLKRLRVNLDAAPQAQFKPTFALRVPMAALEVPAGGNDRHRCIARHESAGDVLVEWIDFDPLAVDERVAHVRRLDDLARVMHSASASHPDLHSVDCLGYTEDRAHSRYGLVYRAPSPSFSSLADLLADLRAPDLDDRVRLAATLALALWSLHSLDWLHKSLCSGNVLFFPSALSTSARSPTASAALVPDVSTPYLSGFDASRPDLDAALSVAPRNPSISALHRHPSSLKGRPHCRAFDAYSLGLVLLEIGLWKPLRTYHKPHYSPERWRDKVVLAALVPALGSKVGRRYRGAVEMCLRAQENMTSEEAGKLMEEVVTTLEGIKV